MVILSVLGSWLILLSWMMFRLLTKPRRVEEPMLMGCEMGEGGNFATRLMDGQASVFELNPSQAQGGNFVTGLMGGQTSVFELG